MTLKKKSVKMGKLSAEKKDNYPKLISLSHKRQQNKFWVNRLQRFISENNLRAVEVTSFECQVFQVEKYFWYHRGEKKITK